MMKPWLLIRGELVQQTDATFGGNGESVWVDHVLCQDGLARYTLRGTTLAGALLATAKKLFTDVPSTIGGDASHKQPSVWRVFTSHPTTPKNTSLRQNVCIDDETGAAKDGALFDSEVLARGTRWSFVLELDLQRAGDDAERIKAMTLQSLQHWQQGYCWLGRSVARGTGWFTLENVQLAEASWDDWPNSNKDVIASIFSNAITLAKYPYTPFQKTGAWCWQTYQLCLSIAPDDYGMDFLAVGGHEGDALLLNVQDDLVDKNRLLSPTDLTTKDWIADQVFAYSRDEHNNLSPYIAGSALRGVLRHAAQWWANKHGLDLAVLEKLFGKLEGDQATASALLVSDAHLLTPQADWQAVLLKMHAEDEFAGGVYSSSLFDRLALSQGSFTATLIIEAKKADLEKFKHALNPALELARQGFLGLGGSAWRGFGHLHWQIEEVNHEQ
jgi:CRISPR/Cas system CSM-associated protein Csm3 (group 7 of RAMP superfamily)